MKLPNVPSMTRIRKIVVIVALLLLAGNIGYRMGQNGVRVDLKQPQKLLTNTLQPESRDVDFSLFWEVWGKLEQRYIDKSKLDPEKMVYGAISGMVSALDDPYTVFLPPQENEDFKQDLNGTFEGIGAQLGSKEDRIVVIAPLKGFPAEKAGIRPGDWIMKVNEAETIGWTVPEAVTKIRGQKGTVVTLTILHENAQQPEDVKVTRDTILVKSVELEFVQTDSTCTANCKEVAVIHLSRFGDQTNDEWSQAVAEIRSNPRITGVVLDLRNNPGGYFQSAVYIASEFLKSGVVVSQENSDGTQETYSVTRVGSLLDIPLTILINKGSASASEIVAGALRDHERGKLIGENTFGKGSVQTPEDLANGAGIHITTARWIMPGGEWINGKGIKPEIEVSLDPEASGSADAQLERALKELQ